MCKAHAFFGPDKLDKLAQIMYFVNTWYIFDLKGEAAKEKKQFG